MIRQNIFILLAFKNKSELDKEAERDLKLYFIMISYLRRKKLGKKFTFYKLFKRISKELKYQIIKRIDLSLFHNIVEPNTPLFFF